MHCETGLLMDGFHRKKIAETKHYDVDQRIQPWEAKQEWLVLHYVVGGSHGWGVWGVILCSLYRNLSVGLHIKSLIFETSIFLLSTKKKEKPMKVRLCADAFLLVITWSQTPRPIYGWKAETVSCQLSAYLIILGGQYEQLSN